MQIISDTKDPLATAVRRETYRQFHRSADYWGGLKHSRILLTGCSGLFGLWILDLIDVANRELGLDIQAGVLTRSRYQLLVRYPHLKQMSGLTPIEGDVRSFSIAGFTPTHLIHGATTSAAETYGGETPIRKFDTLVSGTRHLFTLLPKGEIRSALFLSSGAVYGPPPGDSADILESMPTAPLPGDTTAALGHAKRAAEFLCNAYADELSIPLRVARCFAFSGAGVPMDLHYALGDFVRQALIGNEIVVKGDGKAVRSYLHLGDMAIWLLRLLTDEDFSKPRTVNVGSSKGLSIRDLAHAVAKTVGSGAKVSVKGENDYSVGNPVRSCYVPSTKLAKLYGLDEWTSLDDSLQNMINAAAYPSKKYKIKNK